MHRVKEIQSEETAELVYEKGDTTLTIGLDGDSVSTVEIAAVVEE